MIIIILKKMSIKNILFGSFLFLSSVIGYKCYKILKFFNKIQNIKTDTNTNIKFYDNYLELNYVYNNINYNLYLPFNENKIQQMTNYEVFLLNNNKEPKNITQQPGIPYLVNAQMLNGLQICAINEEQEIDFAYDNIPMYIE